MDLKPTYEELLNKVAFLNKQLTEKKKAELALETSEKRYRDYFERNISGVYHSTPEGKLIDCNSAFANMIGYNLNEIKNINTEVLYPNIKARNSILKNLKEKRNLNNYEVDLKKNDGNIIHCIQNIVGIFDENNELIQFQGYIFEITDRKNTEIALAESESRFKRLFEDLGDAVFVTTIGGDNKGDILEVNGAAIRQTGFSRDELLSMNIVRDLYVEGTGTVTTDEWDELIHKEKQSTAVEQKRRKDGSTFWTEVIITHIEYNGVSAGLSINHDITNRINANKALEDSEKKFRELFEKSGDAFLIIRNREIVDCNMASVKMLNYTNVEEVVNVHPSILSPEYQPDGKLSFEKANEMMSLCIEKGTHRFEWNHKKSDGQVFPVEILLTAISYEPNNEIIHTVWRDITKQNIAREELEKSEKRFRDLFEKSGDSIFILENGIFTDCNIATVNLYGYDNKNELLNLEPKDISPDFQPGGISSVDLSQKVIAKAIHYGTHRFEWEHKKKDGTTFSAEVLLTAISNDPNKSILHAVCRDITERKQNQLDLILAKDKAEESDRLKSAFLANMSHEIRTPMNGILGFASLLKLPNLNEIQLKKYVGIIEKSGLRMLNIINDLMDISKIESGQMEVNIGPCNVNEQLEYLFSFFQPEAEKEELKMSYSCNLSNDEANILTDNEKLYAILANLLKNSIKYSDEGTIRFGYKKKNNKLVFFVKDTGIGIPVERREAVFDRFVQADIEDSKAMEGAGLGLAISKAYVEMLNGNIWLEENEGKGTIFYFTIPYITEKSLANDINSANIINQKENETKKKLNILIADDEEFASTFLQIVLREISGTIYSAKNGIEAVDICKSNPNIDLILMDIKMPLKDGYTATKEIRKFNKDIVIIAQTAYALPGDSTKAIDVGCNDYISKPIDKELLLEKINLLFGR